ncbi:MAG: hypothetical protein AB3N14_00245 [Flavobacteriaceae bacterium]
MSWVTGTFEKQKYGFLFGFKWKVENGKWKMSFLPGKLEFDGELWPF